MSNDTVSTTTVLPPSEEEQDSDDSKTHVVSAGLVGAVILVVVIVVILVVRRRMARHKNSSDSESASDVEMDSVTGVVVYSDTQSHDDIVVTRDGRKLSRKELVESLWVEDEDLRAVLKRYTIASDKIVVGSMIGKGKSVNENRLVEGTSAKSTRLYPKLIGSTCPLGH